MIPDGTVVFSVADGSKRCRIEFPMIFPHEIVAGVTEHLFSSLIYVGEAPVAVESEEAVGNAFQN